MGYFDNMGTGPSSGSEMDFARNGPTNPGAVPATGFYDRMFGHKRGPGSGKHAPAPPLAPSGSPAHTPPVGGPSFSSGPGLVKRIMASIAAGPSYNTDGQPLVPGTNSTVPEMLQSFGRQTKGLVQQASAAIQAAGSQPMNPNLTASASPQGRLPMPMPVQPSPPLPPGFGGAGPRPPGPIQPQLPMPQSGAPRPGFFAGGYARGGYPNLMMGMPIRKAHGGGDDYVPDHGPGDGRSDNVNARLSKGEYVMDAETVALLGNGSSTAGARKLDELRHNLRTQKGKALAKGKISPDAKNPEEYI